MTHGRPAPDVARLDGGATATLRALVALLTGRPVPQDDVVDGGRVITLAMHECCGPLLWARGRHALQRVAPPSAVTELRAHAVAQAMRLRRRLERAAAAGELLAGAGIPFAVWKGMPLSQLAHDDPYLRPSGDVDLWLPIAARTEARRVLVARGWVRVEGEAPWEEAFERTVDGERERLELHSHLQGDLLAHLPSWPWQARTVTLDGVALPAVADAALALSLAIHHARHRTAPLLWAADLRAVMSGVAHADVVAFARRTRTLGYLRHAEQVIAAFDALGDPACTPERAAECAYRLGFRAGRREQGHPAWRDVRYAATVADRVAVVGAWIVPPRVREDGGVVRGSVRRVARLVARTVARPAGRARHADMAPAPGARSTEVVSPERAGAPPVRSLAVDRDDLEVVLRTVMAQQRGSMWLRARGRSMHPTIRDGALVRLVPVGSGPLAPGRVVLARLADGSWALHRVVRETPTGVTLQGDATVAPDPLVARQAVLAMADAVAGPDGAPEPIASRAPWTLVRLTRPARLAWWRLRAGVRARSRERAEAACPT